MDPSFTHLATILACAGLGLSAGALLAEAGLLVPYWRSLSPQEFLEWYPRNAALLLRFFTPLEVVPTVLVLIATAMAFFTEGGPRGTLTTASILAILVLLSFPAYFRQANESFATGSVGVENVSTELARWAAWHRGRTAIATLAFLITMVAL